MRGQPVRSLRDRGHVSTKFADKTPPEPRDQRIGRANRENIKELLATAGLYPLTEQMKSVAAVPCNGRPFGKLTMFSRMPMEEFEELISRARDEAGDPGLKVSRPST